MSSYVSPNEIRAAFSASMSAMYRNEVPAYGELIKIVTKANERALQDPQQTQSRADEDVLRLSDERHGAIRVGTADELAWLGRIFAIMGMFPVSYYDLGSAGIPVHSTAFRPIERSALAANPFRVFTSLLRLDLIEDEDIRAMAESVLASRDIFHPETRGLVERAEAQGGLNADEAEIFISCVLETFRWTGQARIDEASYHKLHDQHRLIADVVSFQGPHINHLTPRTLDIAQCQRDMVQAGLPAKAVIEGPPQRRCPILLRQTSFKALTEAVQFVGSDVPSSHTARFGEIEQRGIALTPKGRALYDRLLADARMEITPKADGSNAHAYEAALSSHFAAFPDDWRAIHDQKLGYFRYHRSDKATGTIAPARLSDALDEGDIIITPVIYEDFLPVSAAGIFQSNLGDNATISAVDNASKSAFESALGQHVLDEFSHYEALSQASLKEALAG